MTYNVQFAGIIYFHVCSVNEEFKAFFPDGTNPGHGIPPHFASIFIEPKDHDSDNWWPGSKTLRQLELEPEPGTIIEVPVFEFRIPKRAKVTFSSNDKPLDLGNVRTALPNVNQLDPDFKLDPRGKIIAEVPLTAGTLAVQSFETAAVVQWTLKNGSDPIVITVQTDKETRRITLKSDGSTPVEVVFSNTSDLINTGRNRIARAAATAAAAAVKPSAKVALASSGSSTGEDEDEDDDEDVHAAIFGQLNKSRDGRAIAASVFPDFTTLPVSQSSHAYLNFLRRVKSIPAPKCSPICCS